MDEEIEEEAGIIEAAEEGETEETVVVVEEGMQEAAIEEVTEVLEETIEEIVVMAEEGETEETAGVVQDLEEMLTKEQAMPLVAGLEDNFSSKYMLSLIHI